MYPKAYLLRKFIYFLKSIKQYHISKANQIYEIRHKSKSLNYKIKISNFQIMAIYASFGYIKKNL